MDISSIQAIAEQYTSESSSAKKLEESLKSDYSTSTSEELMDVCKEFEAYFVEQIFKEMRKTIPESETTSSYTSTMKCNGYTNSSPIQALSLDYSKVVF